METEQNMLHITICKHDSMFKNISLIIITSF